MLCWSWAEQEPRQRLSLTTAHKKGEQSRQCGGGSSHEEPRSEMITTRKSSNILFVSYP